jgi:hypothetical protein
VTQSTTFLTKVWNVNHLKIKIPVEQESSLNEWPFLAVQALFDYKTFKK